MPILTTAAETLARLDLLIERTEDPRHAAMLAAFRTHWWGEVLGDLDLAMSVLPALVQFSVRGAVRRPVEIDTALAQRAHYQRTLDLGLNIGGALSRERFAFADWGMMLDAVLSGVTLGSLLDPSPGDGFYLVHRPIVVVMPFAPNGQMLGEIAYMAAPTAIEPAGPETIRRLVGI
jgi:hypothetical protein